MSPLVARIIFPDEHSVRQFSPKSLSHRFQATVRIFCDRREMSKKGTEDQNPDLRTVSVLDLEEFRYIPPEREERKRRQLHKKMDDLFAIFEKSDQENADHVCDVREVGTIMRSLNLNPTEFMIHQVVESIEETESQGYVKLDKLRNILLDILMTNEYRGQLVVRDDEDTIVRAFEMLDREKKGYVESEYLREVMTTMGEAFSADEINEMIHAASDPETGHIYYEDFAAMLATE